MDPNQCLNLLIDAVLEADWETAQERLDDLRHWDNRRGFPPVDPRKRAGIQIGDGNTQMNNF
jgi:hypothetical protein